MVDFVNLGISWQILNKLVVFSDVFCTPSVVSLSMCTYLCYCLLGVEKSYMV